MSPDFAKELPTANEVLSPSRIFSSSNDLDEEPAAADNPFEVASKSGRLGQSGTDEDETAMANFLEEVKEHSEQHHAAE